MNHKFFIAGTDTNIGKTYVTCGLLKLCNQFQLSTLGLKPIATGAISLNDGNYNDDALKLQKHASFSLTYSSINPFLLVKPVSPNIAATYEKKFITVENLLQQTKKAFHKNVNVTFIEGVGGWFTPINKHETMADFAKALNQPIILVVGIRLGCINHTLLTLSAIQNTHLKIAGWVANCVDKDMLAISENISTIQDWIKSPLIGIIPFKERPEKYLSLEFLSLHDD